MLRKFTIFSMFCLDTNVRQSRRHALLRMRDDFVSERQREAAEAISVMADTARRITQAERDRDGKSINLLLACVQVINSIISTMSGLVILEASYFPLDESGDIVKDLEVDVSCPLQALVQNGQLFVPGGRPKVRILSTGVRLGSNMRANNINVLLYCSPHSEDFMILCRTARNG